jgi:hypothetical protein
LVEFPWKVVVHPLPWGPVSACLANATPENDIVSANASAAINNEMRFLISSHLLSLSKNKTALHRLLLARRL